MIEIVDEKDDEKYYIVRKRARVSEHLWALFDAQYNNSDSHRSKMYQKLDLEVHRFYNKFHALTSIYQTFLTFEAGPEHIFAQISKDSNDELFQIANVMMTSDDNIFRMCIFNTLDRESLDDNNKEIYDTILDRYNAIIKVDEKDIQKKIGKLVEHHIKYKEIHGEDKTVFMTASEHLKLHRRLRREGKCNIPPDELEKISRKARYRTKKYKVYKKAYYRTKKHQKYDDENDDEVEILSVDKMHNRAG